MSNLPLEMIAEILSRLTVKEILCCRRVSKPWCALIDGPDFIKLHLFHSIENSTNLYILLKSSHLYYVSFENLDDPKELDHPLMCYNHRVKVLGSCNGLLCISNVVDDVALWNPSIRKHVVLPFLPLEYRRYYGHCFCRLHVVGFGYDPLHEDYKVVRIAQFVGVDRKIFESEVKVFNLRRKSWRRIADLPYWIPDPGAQGVFANGALHWVVSKNSESNVANTIVALDLATEEFREVTKPKCVGSNFDIDIGVLGGSLCLLANFRKEHVDVWVMKECQVEEPWTKLFSIVCYEVTGNLRFLKPLAYSRSGNKVLMEHNKIHLFWYDLRRKNVEYVQRHGMPFKFEAEICLGSLVSPHLNRFLKGRVHDNHEEKKTNRKKRDDFLSEGFKLVL
uniref:Uncharacterized protein MANES_S015800 n=1 Tax=Rhizophora mucronata TaxID=61149 RepID=A0A2P2PNS7_RHIMU